MGEWMTVKQLAAYLQLSEAKVYELARTRQVPASKLGSQWRFDRAEVDRWLHDQRTFNPFPTTPEANT